MTLRGFALLLLTALCMAAANLFIKTGITAAGGFNPSLSALMRLYRQPAFVFGFSLTGVAALMWFRILATQQLSTCYPLFVSLTYSLITLAAFCFLGERISPKSWLGSSLLWQELLRIAHRGCRLGYLSRDHRTFSLQIGLSGLSLVVPVYRSEAILPDLVQRLSQTLPSLASEYELILVNDSSPDHSWDVISAILLRQYSWIHPINLMRNYGQHNALLCGIRAARYDVIVTMDDDLQHPPEEIPKLLDGAGGRV